MGLKPFLDTALQAAPLLLGWVLVHDSPEGITGGYIVETEAYLASDEASHSYRGKTLRNEVMFGPPGRLYVYFTYGMHYCANIVTGPNGVGEAVLIRALQPIKGIELMRKRRGNVSDIQLANGPAKLTQAMAINRVHKGASILGTDEFQLVPGIKPHKIVITTRVGISQATQQPWRFYIADNPYVSRK